MQIDQKLFMEKVLQLEQQAAEKGAVITPEEIREAFSDTGLTAEQMDEVFRYFEARRIRIEGRERPVDEDPSDRRIHTDETSRDQDMVRLYMAEMETAFRLEEGKEEELLARFRAGDESVRDLLVEGYLPMAAEIADAYRGRGLLHSDLIQECNLGLLMAVSSWRSAVDSGDPEERAFAEGMTFREYLEDAICSHVEDQLSEYTHSMRSARKMVRQMNRLNDTASAFARDHGREATTEELAERMELTEEEIRRLMKSSLDAIHVLETGRFGS